MLITSDPFQYEVVKSTEGDGLQTSIPKAIISNAGRPRSRPKTASMDKPTRTPKPPFVGVPVFFALQHFAAVTARPLFICVSFFDVLGEEKLNQKYLWTLTALPYFAIV